MSDTLTLPRPQRLIDFRIPMWSVIVMLVSFVFSSGGLYVKMQTLQSTLVNIEQKSDRRDTADEEMFRQIDHSMSRMEVLDMRITRNSQDISDLKSQVHDLNTAVTVGKAAR